MQNFSINGFNQLYLIMTSRKNQWSEEEQKLLFQLQAEHGNRWSILATRIRTKDDNAIKNKFYSTLRKGLRKINKYIVSIKKKRDPIKLKGYKTLQQIFITKIIAVVDCNYEQKYEVRQRALELASDIQRRVIQVACSRQQYDMKLQKTDYQMQEKLLIDIHQFNKNCKKRKGKRKQGDIIPQSQENDQASQNQIEQQIIGQKRQIDIKQSVPKEDNQNNGLFQHPQTKQNIILSTQKNIQNETDSKLNYSTSLSNNQKKDELTNNLIKRNNSNATTTLSNSFNFLNKSTQFKKQQQDFTNLQNSNNFAISNSWMYQSMNSSREISKKMTHFLTQPSPIASDTNNPFTFGSLMKNSNFSCSNMFQDKNYSNDLFSSEKYSQGKPEDNVLSLVDQIPLFTTNTSSYLIKSTDLQQSTELSTKQYESKQSLNMFGDFEKKIAGNLNSYFPVFNSTNIFKINNELFAKEYNFSTENDIKGQSEIKSLQQLHGSSINELQD